MTYRLHITKRAQEWLDAQDAVVRGRVLLSLNEILRAPRKMGMVISNPKWHSEIAGEAYCFKMYCPAPGIRAIYYVIDEHGFVVVRKIDRRDANPYEDGR
jgi:mRNA-degrading endonuclease RelE of RelBE toxin-antitoxin system